jgi:protein-disulfide isomerase-like protein with CxxC motif
MCDKELIVGYIYGELSRDEREVLNAHLAVCGDCRVEIEELRSARQHLTLWAPPEPDLGFRVIRGGAAPAPALPRRSRSAAAFRYAAAAGIVLAAAAAIANLEVRYGADGLVVRTGWTRGGTAATDARTVSTITAAEQAVPSSTNGDFAALDQRLRQIESVLNAPAAAGFQATSDTRMSDAEMLRRVRQFVSEAEQRQQTDVAHRLLDVARAFDLQRRADIAYFQQGLGQYQGQTNAEIAQNRELVNQIIRAAARQEK